MGCHWDACNRWIDAGADDRTDRAEDGVDDDGALRAVKPMTAKWAIQDSPCGIGWISSPRMAVVASSADAAPAEDKGMGVKCSLSSTTIEDGDSSEPSLMAAGLFAAAPEAFQGLAAAEEEEVVLVVKAIFGSAGAAALASSAARAGELDTRTSLVARDEAAAAAGVGAAGGALVAAAGVAATTGATAAGVGAGAVTAGTGATGAVAGGAAACGAAAAAGVSFLFTF